LERALFVGVTMMTFFSCAYLLRVIMASLVPVEQRVITGHNPRGKNSCIEKSQAG
jgi:hypothetical protein